MASSTFWRLLRLTGAGALTFYALWRAHPSEVLTSARDARWTWISAAIALTLIDRSLMAYRWIALLCTVDPLQRPPLSRLFRIFFESTFLGTFLPASVGGDAARAFQLARDGVSTAPAVASVLMDRLLGVVALCVMGVAGLWLVSADASVGRAVQLSLSVAVLASAVALLVVFSERAATTVRFVGAVLPLPRVSRTVDSIVGATRAYQHHHGTLWLVLAASIGVQVVRIIQAYYLGRALGIDAPFSVYAAYVPLILLVMLLPVSVNGIGPSQVAFVWFFGKSGVPESQAFALSVLFVALGVVGNLPGGLSYAIGRGSTARADIAARKTSTD